MTVDRDVYFQASLQQAIDAYMFLDESGPRATYRRDGVTSQ